MKKRSISMTIAVSLAFTIIAVVTAKADGSGIQWFSYAEGVERGKAEQKKIFLVFQADWCRYCHQMEKETFRDSTVAAYVNRNFIPINVNSDKENGIAAKYNVSGLPSTWFISEKGDRIGNRPGYIPTKEMLQLLKYVGTDSYLTMSYKDFLKKK